MIACGGGNCTLNRPSSPGFDGCPLEAARGGTAPDSVFVDRPRDAARLPQQVPRQIEALRRFGVARAGHLTYMDNSLRHPSRCTSLMPVLRCSLKFEVIFCVQGVATQLLAGMSWRLYSLKVSSFLPALSPSRLRRSRRAWYAYNFRRLRGQTFPASNRHQLLQTRGADRGRTFPQVIARRHRSSPKIRALRVCERFPRPYAREHRKLAKRLRSSLPTRFPRIHRSSSMADLGEQVRQSYL
jgi:hypothetical protein